MKTTSADKAWFRYLMEHSLASSGHMGNLIGMRRIWGKDALVVRCCGYLFWVTYDVFQRVMFK